MYTVEQCNNKKKVGTKSFGDVIYRLGKFIFRFN